MVSKKAVIYEFAKAVDCHSVYFHYKRLPRCIDSQFNIFFANDCAQFILLGVRHDNDSHVPFVGSLHRPQQVARGL